MDIKILYIIFRIVISDNPKCKKIIDYRYTSWVHVFIQFCLN